MEQTQLEANNRNSLRMTPENDRAGIYLRKRAVRVQLLNLSSTGCGFRAPKKHKIAVGDVFRVATTQGQFESIVRRVTDDVEGDPKVNVVGVEFQKEIKQKTKRGSAFSTFKGDARHQISGGGSAAAILIVVVWLALGLLAAAYFIGFDKFPVLQDYVK